MGRPPCVKHRGPFFFTSAEDFSDFNLRASALAKHVWISTAQSRNPLALGLCATESRHDFKLSAVQISGLPGNDRPLTHTVTVPLARSSVLARWSHVISSPIVVSGGHHVQFCCLLP